MGFCEFLQNFGKCLTRGVCACDVFFVVESTWTLANNIVFVGCPQYWNSIIFFTRHIIYTITEPKISILLYFSIKVFYLGIHQYIIRVYARVENLILRKLCAVGRGEDNFSIDVFWEIFEIFIVDSSLIFSKFLRCVCVCVSLFSIYYCFSFSVLFFFLF